MAEPDASGVQFDIQLLQARWAVGGLNAEELTQQMLVALERGHEGAALQQLAGLVSPSFSDLGTLPQRAFAELGLKPIDREQAIDVLCAHRWLTCDTVLAIVAAFPDFNTRWREHLAYWDGQKAGVYLDMAEFVHFVVEDLYDKGKIDEVRRVFQFFERQLAECNQETRDLIGLGFFETLQNVASHQSYGYRAFEEFLGTTSLRIWNEIERMWDGKSSLMDVLRAERGK